MTFDEWKFFFIAYASVLSTISIVWNIRDAVRKNRGDLKIDYGVYTQFAFDNYGNKHGGYTPVLSYTITNAGYRLLHIESPSFEFFENGKRNKKKEANTFKLHDLNRSENFPQPLASGETYKRTVNLSHFLEQLKNAMDPNGKFRIVVQDTFGKRHKSPKSKVKSLLEHVKMVDALE